MGEHPGAVVDFRCNICATANSRALDDFHRETPDCRRCGSSPRMRGIIHALSLELFGRSLPLPAWPERQQLRGIGFSDSDTYAVPLSCKTDFTNTFLHREPKLDLLTQDWRRYAGADFIICAEVLEHVLAPVERALDHLHSLLAPGGVVILSTPFTAEPATREHFPGLSNFTVAEQDGGWAVINTRADGRTEVFERDIHFHGGPGLVLEMRSFGEADLMSRLAAAGFTCDVHEMRIVDIGYVWERREQRPGGGVSLDHVITARAA